MKKNIFSLLLTAWFILGCGSNGSVSDTVATNENNTEVVDTNNTEIIDVDDDRVIKEVIIEVKPDNWYIRIVAEDTTNNMKTAGAQLGQLEGTDVALMHSLKAIAPFGTTYLDVVFQDPNDLAPGLYKSNFHESGISSDSWEFTVKSHDADADMVLSWRGLYVLEPYIDSEDRVRYHEYRSLTNPLIPNMKLVDVERDMEIAAQINGNVQAYAFNMDGATEKTFRWIIEDTEVIQTASSKQVELQKLQVEVLRKDAQANQYKLTEERVQSFDMTKPPEFKVLVK